ncbi:hypothetical protein GF323_03610 [Candidatus Woesearchaeota archaeon]|nr:hypothetical protein [Candidatus Woesearchaeota archaeon]
MNHESVRKLEKLLKKSEKDEQGLSKKELEKNLQPVEHTGIEWYPHESIKPMKLDLIHIKPNWKVD